MVSRLIQALLLGLSVSLLSQPALAETRSGEFAGSARCTLNPQEPDSEVNICYVEDTGRLVLTGVAGDSFEFVVPFSRGSMTLGSGTDLALGISVRRAVPEPGTIFVDDLRIALLGANGTPTTPFVSLGTVDSVQGCSALFECGYGLYKASRDFDHARVMGVAVQLDTRALEDGISISVSLADAAVRGGGRITRFPSPLIFHTVGAELGSATDNIEYVSSAALPDLNGNGYPELALLRWLQPSGVTQIMIRDTRTGANVDFLGTFAEGWQPIDIATLDTNLDTVPELAVLAKNSSTGAVRVQLYDVQSRKLLRGLTYLSGDWQPRSLSVQDVNLDGYPDLTVVATSASRGFGVMVTRSVEDGEQLRWLRLPLP